MNVVIHEHVAVHLDPEKFPGLVNDLQESLPVAVVPKYRPDPRFSFLLLSAGSGSAMINRGTDFHGIQLFH
jgi:hypothetical protein